MVVFEILAEVHGSRGPVLFETTNRPLAWKVATACEQLLESIKSEGSIVMLCVQDDCILNAPEDVWKHPDFLTVLDVTSGY